MSGHRDIELAAEHSGPQEQRAVTAPAAGPLSADPGPGSCWEQTKQEMTDRIGRQWAKDAAAAVVPNFSGLFLCVAVGDDVIGITLERTIRMLPGHPHIERVVHERVPALSGRASRRWSAIQRSGCLGLVLTAPRKPGDVAGDDPVMLAIKAMTW